ncbi:class I SAM-dependent methyltransferase [Polynucleobacter paneuropaeus]|nr:class I SAM-dependent methyltransferase [Polynucleobacter paneuropaeus]
MWNEVWSKIFTSQAWGKYPSEELIRFVAKNFYKADDRSRIRILELGCGPGANLWFLEREGFSFVGIDGSKDAIQQASERLDLECPNWRHKSRLIVGDVSSYEFMEEEFDAIIDHECVYCMPFDVSQNIYSRSHKYLKTGGVMFVRTFATDTWGYGTGEKVGEDMYICDDGPLAGKGPSRFTALEQIKGLFSSFSNIEIDKITKTYNGLDNVISEWIIVAKK